MTDVILEGYLLKKSPHTILGRHPWQRRYFVLTDTTLSYYKQHIDAVQHSTQPAGIFRHEMIKSIDLCAEKDKHTAQVIASKLYNSHSTATQLRFNITIVGSRIFELQCNSIEQKTTVVYYITEMCG
jgi:hypothetical protein